MKKKYNDDSVKKEIETIYEEYFLRKPADKEMSEAMEKRFINIPKQNILLCRILKFTDKNIFN